MGNCIRPSTRSIPEDSHESRSPEMGKKALGSSTASTDSSWYASTTSAGSSSNASKTSTQTRLKVVKLQNELKQLKEAKDSRLAYLEKKHAAQVNSRWKEINELISMAQTLDLAFLFDATGSMCSHMRSMKNWIAYIAREIAKEHPECSMRVAFALYRDYYDKEDCQSCDFTASFDGSDSVFVKALSDVPATGGDDTAEDVFSGLERIAALSWEAANRIVFHIADAPCHGTQFHTCDVGDNFPDGDKLGRNIITLLCNLRDSTNISCYYFLHIKSTTKKMLQKFREAAVEKSGDEWIQEDDFNTKNEKDIPSKVVKVCSNSINKTLSSVATCKSKLEGRKLIPCTVQPSVPDWTPITPEKGQQYGYKWYGNLQELLSKLSSGKTLVLELLDPVMVRIAPLPFSNEGAIRWPHYAQLVAGKGSMSMVMKRFKMFIGQDTNEVHAKEKYLEQMEVQSVAAQMAHQFNICTKGFYGVKQVKFTQVSTVEVGSIVGHTTKFYNMEKELTGKWIRYSNNAGYVNTEAYAATLQAFSHWTHEYSKGLLMVTDLQGVQIQDGPRDENYEFQLCDPSIHCKDLSRFTRTNLGERGFQLFYKSHKCNDVCKKLKLPTRESGYTMEGIHPGSK